MYKDYDVRVVEENEDEGTLTVDLKIETGEVVRVQLDRYPAYDTLPDMHRVLAIITDGWGIKRHSYSFREGDFVIMNEDTGSQIYADEYDSMGGHALVCVPTADKEATLSGLSGTHWSWD